MSEVFSSHSMLSAYNALAVRSWEDPSIRGRLTESPRDALAAYGWELPEDTRVRIEFVEPAPDSPQLGPEQIVAHWRHGIEAGDLLIRIAAEPPDVESAELARGRPVAGLGGGSDGPVDLSVLSYFASHSTLPLVQLASCAPF